MSYNIQEILRIFDNEENITTTARKYCDKHGLEYSDSVRRKFSKIINSAANSNENHTPDNDYSNDIEQEERYVFSALDISGKLLNIDEYCDKYGLDRSGITSYKLITHINPPAYNIVFKDPVIDSLKSDTEFIDELLKKYLDNSAQESEPIPQDNQPQKFVDRLVISDVHINMNTQGGKETVSIYNEVPYDIQEIISRIQTTVDHVLNYKRSETLIIDNLGDFMDGEKGQTTRGGHGLPQLYSDKEAFAIGVEFNVMLVEKLLRSYSKVVVNSIMEDNHSHLFSYYVFYAAKNILELKYGDRVEFNIIEKFLHHYKVGNHTFVITHGKDSVNMKFGMKLYLDDRTVTYLDGYCKEFGLYDGSFIHISKGDLHKHVVDQSNKRFDYINYPAFCPTSDWIQTNFGMSRGGIVFENIDIETDIITRTPLFF